MGSYTWARSAWCDGIEGAGWTCMVCTDAEATGHVIVNGGRHDGRLVLLCCATCAGFPAYIDAMPPDLTQALTDLVMEGLLDLDTGGPGPNGVPRVWHRDHFDDLPKHSHARARRRARARHRR